MTKAYLTLPVPALHAGETQPVFAGNLPAACLPVRLLYTEAETHPGCISEVPAVCSPYSVSFEGSRLSGWVLAR